MMTMYVSNRVDVDYCRGCMQNMVRFPITKIPWIRISFDGLLCQERSGVRLSHSFLNWNRETQTFNHFQHILITEHQNFNSRKKKYTRRREVFFLFPKMKLHRLWSEVCRQSAFTAIDEYSRRVFRWWDERAQAPRQVQSGVPEDNIMIRGHETHRTILTARKPRRMSKSATSLAAACVQGMVLESIASKDIGIDRSDDSSRGHGVNKRGALVRSKSHSTIIQHPYSPKTSHFPTPIHPSLRPT